jgi:F-type H+-transporting ATPase subunit epsilon
MAFQCTIVTPEAQALDESANQVILPAWDGQMGILTNRSPLLAKLGMGTLKIDLASGKSRSFFIDGGVAQMNDNKLTILTDEATALEDLTAESARKDFATAEARQGDDPKTRDVRKHQMDRAKMKQGLAKK